VSQPAPIAKPLKVLAVDDDPLVLMNTTAMLEDLGHEVLEANSGEHALRVLRRATDLDIVITDQLMPGMTGLQLVDAIRDDYPNIPVIIATGYADLPSDTDASVRRLSKPFQQQELARAIAASTQPEAELQAGLSGGLHPITAIPPTATPREL
jgi:CheY-like chemotaxis protein